MATRKQLLAYFDVARRAASPATCLPAHLPAPPAPSEGRLVIIAIGKAAASMAAAAEDFYEAEHPDTQLTGLALTRYGHRQPTRHIRVIEAAHPVPDEAGMAASEEIITLARSLKAGDIALVLLSGGGSALATLPIDGVSLEAKQQLTRALLASGAAIGEINCLRKHLSRIKGGRLAEAIHPARCITIAISDVAGDDPSIIASGPTMPDPTTKADALALLDRLDGPFEAIRTALIAAPETPKSGAPCFAGNSYRLAASGQMALNAAAALAQDEGYEVLMLGDALEGEARHLAQQHADIARQLKAKGRRAAILSGGEAGVTFKDKKTVGEGGPNQEYALALAMALQGAEGISALAADTDGIDGGSGRTDDPAGAMIFPDTLMRAEAAKISAETALKCHDSGTFFRNIGDLVQTGPSFTNVNDFRVILVENEKALRRTPRDSSP
ncbi:MAG: DUF4147 domain-containing protein [Rhizobiales bacterium]|nr:DUF4147 domain-containing protein [Hyphomicrobiales bacterium]